MDKVTLDGKTYEKSAVVAKRYGYTPDYLGQLSRAEKVDAQLVGRSWYVHAPSVEAYQAGLDDEDTAPQKPTRPASLDQTSSPAAPEKTDADLATEGTVEVAADNRSYPVETHAGADEKSFISRLSRLDEKVSVTPEEPEKAPAAAAKTQESLAQPPKRRARSRFSSAEPVSVSHHWQKVVYEKDDGALAPDVNKPSEVPPVHELGKKVRVHSNTDKFSIVASAMPEVPLRGEVSVQGVDEENEETLSLHYQEANTRVRQQLAELEPQHRRRQQPATEPAAVTEPVAASDQEPANTPADNPAPRAVTRWATRLAWTGTLLLLLVAVAGLFLAGETTSGDVAASPLGLTFAPADWFYQIWPF